MAFWEDNGPASWYSQVTAWHIYLFWNEKELLQHKWPKILSCKVVFSKGPLNTRQAWVSLIKSQTIVSAATAKLSYSLGLCHSPPTSSRYPRHSHLSNCYHFCGLFPAHTFASVFPLTSYLPLFIPLFPPAFSYPVPTTSPHPPCSLISGFSLNPFSSQQFFSVFLVPPGHLVIDQKTSFESDNKKFWQGCEEIGTLIQRWWEYAMVQLLENKVCQEGIHRTCGVGCARNLSLHLDKNCTDRICLV